MTYEDFVNNVFSIMQTFGVLEPIKYFILFILAIAGIQMFLKMLRGS